MSSPSPTEFKLISGVRQSSARAIGFLSGDDELDAQIAYDNLSEKSRETLTTRIEHWVAGNNGPKQYFHGWPNDKEVDKCFTFKLPQQRWYGFIYHPLRTNLSFQICALCIHDSKTTEETDRTILKHVMIWYTSAAARNAIAKIYPDRDTREITKWTQ